MIPKNYNNFANFNMEQLTAIRQKIKLSKTKNELLNEIDDILVAKELEMKTLNYHFLIDWMNIDIQYKKLLHQHEIENVSQLRAIENLEKIPGITQSGIEQLLWARDFFDMSNLESLINQETESTQLEVAKVIVKHATEVSKQHNKCTNEV